MESIIRPLILYFFLLVIVRIGGRRTLASMTAFDFVLLLVIGEATQQALLGDDFSIVNSLLVISALVGADIAMSVLKQRSKRLEKVIDGVPVVLVEDGLRHHDRMNHARIDDGDILEAGRQTHGLERLDQVRYAVLERTGGISIIPYPEHGPAPRPVRRSQDA